MYDLINWQTGTDGTLRLVLIGGVAGFDLQLNESEIEWSSKYNQVIQRKNLNHKSGCMGTYLICWGCACLGACVGVQ